MVSSMDHKRALDGDEGLNTGGMGTIAPNPYYCLLYTSFEAYEKGRGFAKALRTRTFEPDAPNFTPRISGVVKVSKKGKMSYKMSILRSDEGNGGSVERFFFEYPQPVPGEGRFLHTYRCDGNPIPSFSGEPEKVRLSGDILSLIHI